MKWLKYLPIGFYILGWFEKVKKDGKISEDEIKDLIVNLLDKLDIKDIKVG